MSTTYKYEEMSQRLGFRKDISDETFLTALNRRLEPFEEQATDENAAAFPRVLILGLHRSGTTVLSQLLAHYLGLGVVDNIAARFWLAPATGIRLSRMLLGNDRVTTLSSTYGKTAGLGEPHEFSYFWHHWFKMENMPPYDPAAAARTIDWTAFTSTMRSMTRAWGKPMVLKAPDVAYHAEDVATTLPEDIFINITRDPADIVVSLLRARMAYYGNTETWLGSYPERWDVLQGMNGRDQVAGQVLMLADMTRKGLRRLPARRVVHLTLQHLCADPASVIADVRDRLNACPGVSVDIQATPPEKLAYNTYESTPEYAICAQRLAAMREKLLSMGLLDSDGGEEQCA